MYVFPFAGNSHSAEILAGLAATQHSYIADSDIIK